MKIILLSIALLISGFVAKGQDVDSSLNTPVSELPSNSLAQSNQVFTAVMVEPLFPGGINKFNEYITDSTRYNGHRTVVANFIVEKNGSLSNITILKSANAKADAECIRLLQNCPKWLPGKQLNVPVSVMYSARVEF